MKLFKVIRNGIVTNQWDDSHGLDQTYYEPSFGKPLRWVRQGQEDLTTAVATRMVTDSEGTTHEEFQLPAEFSIQVVDVTAQVQAQQLLNNGMLAQEVGARAVAKVWAINEGKNITSQQFQTLMADTTLQNIERLLWNGSLKTAKALIQSYQSSLFTSDDIASIIAIIDESGLV